MYTNKMVGPMHDYARPSTLTEAFALRNGQSRILAGGTDLYPGAGVTLSGAIVDIAGVPGLSGITQLGQELRIGACTSWADIARAKMPPALAALQQASVQIGGRQIQNAGTIGGNLCNASPAADGVPPLLVLGAEVEIASTVGTRRVPLEGFITGPRKVALTAEEILVAIVIPAAGLTGKSAFRKLGARAYLVISIAMVAARIVQEQGRITGAFLAVGSCSAVARRLRAVEAALIGAPAASVTSLIRDADVAAALDPIDDIRATAEYRAVIAAEMLRRTVAEALS